MNTHPVILLEAAFHFLDAVIRDYGLYLYMVMVRGELAESEPSTAESYINHAAAYRRRLQQRFAALRTELEL